jgi:hypothetical protein
MTEEKLKKSLELKKQIGDLKEHLGSVFSEYNRYNEKKGNPFSLNGELAKFCIKPWFTSDERTLVNDFVPFPIDKFMKIYKSNLEEEIKRLEIEFDKL